MIRSDIIVLSRFIQKGYPLKTRAVAKRIWAEEYLAERGCLRIDFSHIGPKDISQDFIKELFRLDVPECRVVWMSPINYSPEVGRMLAAYFLKLKRLRDLTIKDGLVKAQLLFEPEQR